ncbi:MAG: hypothetical protein ACUVTN_05640 [Thermodesulfobacteriota bacterium]
MKIIKLFTRGKQAGSDEEKEYSVGRETRSYEELMDELMQWNVEQTDILEVLRKEVEEVRLKNWSEALKEGIRRHLFPYEGKAEASRFFPIYRDLYQFVKGLRIKLFMNPTMKNAKGVGKSDPISICIICGIRALQKEKGFVRPLDTLQWMILERYFLQI